MARKKPTIREVAATANQAIQRTEIIRKRMIEMEIVLSSYIELNKDEKKLAKFIERKSKELSETPAGQDLDNK